MTYTKTFFTTTIMAGGLLLTACTSSSLVTYNDYMYKGINFGSDRDASFKKGVQDACKTAGGDYTKNHVLFNNDISYKDGWEDGRLQCKGKQTV